MPPLPPPPPGPVYIPASILRERMEAAGKWDAMAALLAGLMSTQPGLVLKLLTLNEGVDIADPQARALVAAAGADPERHPGAVAMSTEVDALTPVDQAPGNVVRMPSQKLPVFSGLLIWSRAAGRPVWTPIPAPQPTRRKRRERPAAG